MGDFVKGPIPKSYCPQIATGLQLHRRVDSFAHSNCHIRNSKQRLNKKYGLGRGIIIDIFYDHFLASSWQEFSSDSLEIYAKGIYSLLQKHYHQLPEALQTIAPKMIKNNWLVSYQDFNVIGFALERVSQRLTRRLPLADAVEDLVSNEQGLKSDFRAFMEEATIFAGQILKSDENV